MPARTHAKYSPSALRSWELCPGFVNDGVSGPAAAEGTMLHEACEANDTSTLDSEQRDAVGYCLDYVNSLRTEFCKLKLEITLNIADLTYGTADVLISHAVKPKEPAKVDLVDYKFGRNEVDGAEFNLQGQAYALGVFTEFKSVTTVTVHFVMPRLDVTTKHEFNRADVAKMKGRIATVIARRQEYEKTQDKTLLKAWPENCLYCANKVRCDVWHQTALVLAPKYAQEFVIPDQYDPSQLTDPVQLGHGFALAQVMEKWVKAMKDHAKEQALNGIEVVGFELKERAGVSKITDAMAAYLALKDQIDAEDFIACCDVSASQLATKVGEEAPKGGKGKAMAAFKDTLKDLGLITQAEPVYFLQRAKP